MGRRHFAGGPGIDHSSEGDLPGGTLVRCGELRCCLWSAGGQGHCTCRGGRPSTHCGRVKGGAEPGAYFPDGAAVPWRSGAERAQRGKIGQPASASGGWLRGLEHGGCCASILSPPVDRLAHRPGRYPCGTTGPWALRSTAGAPTGQASGGPPDCPDQTPGRRTHAPQDYEPGWRSPWRPVTARATHLACFHRIPALWTRRVAPTGSP